MIENNESVFPFLKAEVNICFPSDVRWEKAELDESPQSRNVEPSIKKRPLI